MAEYIGSEVEVFGGYSQTFVDSIHARFICSICTKVLRDPHLMICCGQKYCISCLKSWFVRHGSKSCPHCRAVKSEEPILHVSEKGMKSEIESFKIQCSKRHQGCEWIGELRDLDKHFKSDTGCSYYKVECSNKCECDEGIITIILRKDLQVHLSEYCELRLAQCKYCAHVGTVKKYPEHEKVCQLYPINCPNVCGAKGIVRQTLYYHLFYVCPLEVIECENSYLGCRKTLQRRKMHDHIAKYCNFRFLLCQYCASQVRVKDYSGHRLVCDLYPVKCPNDCNEEGITRKTLADHRQVCKCEVIECKYGYVGCGVSCKREHMPQHLVTDQGKHLDMVTEAHEKLILKDKEMCIYVKEEDERKRVILKDLQLNGKHSIHLKSSITQLHYPLGLSSDSPLYFRMLDYDTLKARHKEWKSPVINLDYMNEGINAEICLRVVFSYIHIIIQLHVISINFPYMLKQPITVNVVQQEQQQEVRTKLFTVAKYTKLMKGMMETCIIDIKNKWERKHVLRDSILWHIH